MTTLTCRNIAKDCIANLSADTSMEIQKVFLDHVHAQHPQQWKQYSRQFRSVSIVTIRNRFLKKGMDAVQAS